MQLANEVEDLLKHILNTLAPDAARWLLNVLRNFYYGALRGPGGNREVANSKLRNVVEKVFDYPDSRLRNCMIATTVTSQLMGLEENILRKTLEEALGSGGGEIVVGEFEKTIPESGRIKCRGKFEKGLYLIRVLREDDGEVFEWSSRRDEASEILNINVPEKFLKELAGREVKISIIRYDYSMHFKCKDSSFYFSPKDGLIVEGKEVELESVKSQSWSERHGASMIAKLKQRSIREGAEIYFAFYEDGDFSIAFNEEAPHEKGGYKAALSVEGNLLIIKYGDYESTIPISVQEWKMEEKYYLNIPVGERGRIGLVEELRRMFGYYNVEVLRKKIEEGELELVAYFDNGRHAFCGAETLEINVPEETEPKKAEWLRYVVIQPRPRFLYSEVLSDEQIESIKKASSTKLGEYGRDLVRNAVNAGKLSELEGAEFVAKEVHIKVTDERVGLVFKTKDGRLIVIEVKSTRVYENIGDDIREGLKQLKEYKEHIEEHGLDLSKEGYGVEKGENIKAYIVAYVYFNLVNRKVEVGCELLSEG